jgi:HAD superfamily phosphoserine phosphatase-like hydrolase
MTISIYDMDRTLTRRGTFLPWLLFWLRREAPWRALLLPVLLAPALAYRLGVIDRGALKAWAHRIVMGGGVARARVAAAAAAFAQRIVADEVFPGALAALAADRAAGHRLVIATASNAYYADAIGAALGVEAVVATASTWEGGTLRPALAGENCYGDAKARMIAAWLAAAGVDGITWRFHSDHVSDLPAFDAALASGGAAIAVNPSSALRAEAARRGWPIVDWGVPAASLFESA